MSDIVEIGSKRSSRNSDGYTNPADALLLERMIARHGLANVLRELASAVGDMGDGCTGQRRQSLWGGAPNGSSR